MRILLIVEAVGTLACAASTAPAVTFRRHGLTNAECMVHDPHWSEVVTYYADTTMTVIARADTVCSITGPVGGVPIGGGGKP